MTAAETVINVIRAVLRRRHGQESEEVSQASLLREDLALDSFALVEVLLELEDAFGCSFDDGAFAQSPLMTAADLCQAVQKAAGRPDK